MNSLQKIACTMVALLCFSGLVRSAVLTPVDHFALPLGHGYAIGLQTDGTQLFLFSLDSYYTSPIDVGGNMTFTKAFVDFPAFGVRLTVDSIAKFNPVNTNEVAISGGFGINVVLYSFQMSPPTQTNVPLTDLLQKPAGLAVAENGTIFLSAYDPTPEGIFKLPNADDGTAELIFGTSGPGKLNTPQALSFGPNGLLYVLDTGDGRVVAFNTDGEYQSAFDLVGEAMGSALAIDDQGRLYTMNSLGGGDIYDIYTGAHVGTLENTNDVGVGLGKASLLYTGGYLFATTGHGANVYIYAVPEPDMFVLLSLALAGIAVLARNRRRSSREPQVDS